MKIDELYKHKYPSQQQSRLSKLENILRHTIAGDRVTNEIAFIDLLGAESFKGCENLAVIVSQVNIAHN